MGYYTETVDAVAPKGGEKSTDDRVNLILANMYRFVRAAEENEKRKLLDANVSKKEISKNLNNLERIKIRLKKNMDRKTDVKEDLISDEESRMLAFYTENFFMKIKYKKLIEQYELGKTKNSLISRLLKILKHENPVSVDELRDNMDKYANLSDLVTLVLYKEFQALTFEDKVKYSIIMSERAIKSLESLPRDEVNEKTLHNYFFGSVLYKQFNFDDLIKRLVGNDNSVKSETV